MIYFSIFIIQCIFLVKMNDIKAKYIGSEVNFSDPECIEIYTVLTVLSKNF